MQYLLDTNSCIEYLRDQDLHDAFPLAERLWSTPKEDVAVCSVVRAELVYGAEKSSRSAANLVAVRRFLSDFPSLAFDDAAADIFAHIRLDLERKGTRLDVVDLMIAAIALANDVTLVTHDQHFSRIPGLQLDDWQ